MNLTFIQLRSIRSFGNNKSLNHIYQTYDDDLVTLNVIGVKTDSSDFPISLPDRPEYLRDLRDVAPDEISDHFVLEIDDIQLNGELWSGPENIM